MSDERHRNCWTCRHDHMLDEEFFPGVHTCHWAEQDHVRDWITTLDNWDDDSDMPPTETDPCPGWASRSTATTGVLAPTAGARAMYGRDDCG